MGLVKTSGLAAMQKQTTYAKATVARQCAKFGTPPSVEKGGATTIENGQVLCPKCNASNGAR